MALEKSQIVRCGEHSDYGTITFLYQDDMEGTHLLNVTDIEDRTDDHEFLKHQSLYYNQIIPRK